MKLKGVALSWILTALYAVKSSHALLRGLEEGAVNEPVEIEQEKTIQESWEEGSFFEGDLRLSFEQTAERYGEEKANELVELGLIPAPESEEQGRRLGISSYRRWSERDSNGRVIIRFTFQAGNTFRSSDISLIRQAMTNIEATGVISFLEYSPPSSGAEDHIIFDSANTGCWSYVGRISGGQKLNLETPGCFYSGTSTAEHELMHAIGFLHEQSRSDRDDHVQINYDNIKSGRESNFAKANTNSLGSEYDHASVMHYGGTAFGKRKVSCSSASSVGCGYVAKIQFRGNQQDSSPYCLNTLGKFELCSDSAGNQEFFLKNIGHSVELRSAAEPTKCLVPPLDYWGNLYYGNKLTLQSCESNHAERFQIHGSSFNLAYLRWEGDRSYGLNREGSGSAATVPGSDATLRWATTAAEQRFKIVFSKSNLYSSSSFTCQSYKICSAASGTETTISSSKSLGNRVGMTDEDFKQITLMYQCSAPRNYNSLCSEDCPCREGQYSCNTALDCQGSLVCNSERVCVKPTCVAPSPGKLIQTVSFGSNFEIDFDVTLQSINDQSWTSVLFVGSDPAVRIAAAYVPVGTSKLTFRFASQKSNSRVCDPTSNFVLGRQYSVKMKVLDGVAQAYVDGSLACSIDMNSPGLGANNEPLYLGVSNFKAADACVSDVAVQSLSSDIPAVCTGMTPSRSKLYQETVSVDSDFSVSFDISLNEGSVKNWENVLHLGESNYPRLASVFVIKETRRLSFRTATASKPNIICDIPSDLELDREYKFEMKVIGPWMTVYQDSVEVCSRGLGDVALGASNEPLYVSSPFHASANACLKNLQVTSLIPQDTIIRPSKGFEVTTVSFGSSFTSEFDFVLNEIHPSSWTNVFHVGATTTRHCDIFVLPNTSQLSFRAASQHSPNNSCTPTVQLQVGRKYRIRYVVDGLVAKVFYDGLEVCQVQMNGSALGANSEPLYISSPYFKAADAEVTNLSFN